MHGRALRLAWTALAGAWLCPLALADATPQDALAYPDPAVAEARQELALRERMLAVGHGLDASVTLEPAVRYGTLGSDTVVFGDIPGPGSAPTWSTEVYLGATIGYSFDPLSTRNDRVMAEQARADLDAARRRSVYQTLDVHAQMLSAQLAVAQRAAALSAAEGALQAAAAAPDVARARLLVARHRLGLEEDRQRLAALKREAASRGLEGLAVYAPLRFVLPEPDLERTAGYRLAVLEVERARAAAARGGLLGAIQGLAADASYASGGVRLSARAGVIDGRPRAELGVDYPGGGDGWSLGVSATVAVVSDAGRQAEARLRADRAGARLAAYVRQFPTRAARLRAEAAFAERALALDEEQLALARAGLADADLASDPERGAHLVAGGLTGGSVGGGAVLYGPNAARVAVWSAERALYGDWGRYLRSVSAYLDYIEASWQPRRR